ncbi:MAG: hypothetical protein ACLP8X_26540 [Streptosporangiaceae bacterium]
MPPCRTRACKDPGLAVEEAGQVGVPVEVSAAVEQVYRRTRAQYGDAGGTMLPVRRYEDLTRAPSASPHRIVDRHTPYDGCNDPR